VSLSPLATEAIPPSEKQPIVCLTYEANQAGWTAGATSPLTIVDCLGSGEPVAVQVTIDAAPVAPLEIADGLLTCGPGPSREAYRRGDANVDGTVNVADAVFILEFLFLDGRTLPCADAGDTNNDNELDIADPVYLLSYIFLNGVAPEAPGPEECGTDPDALPSSLGCESYDKCDGKTTS
jgi:hypothetical protein